MVKISLIATQTIALLLLTTGCQAVPRRASQSYMGLSKHELIRELGLPAEIELPTEGAPAQEIWFYYWDDPRLGISAADFQFCGNVVCGYLSAFDAKRLISTETREGFRRVYQYKLRERMHSRR